MLNLKSVLTNAGFVKVNTFANAMELAIISGIPIMFYGRGGYGKTEMIKAVFASLDCTSAMLECDPETTASLIKGGAIARTTKSQKEDITSAYYNISASILQNEAFFYEEMLDATFQALSALKAIITNNELTLNGNVVKSLNELLVAATNVDPYGRIEQLPPSEANSYEAFLQRFIVVRHEWDSHDADDYRELLNVSKSDNNRKKISIADIKQYRDQRSTVQLDKELQGILASLAEKSANEGKVVSPRTFMWTKKMLQSQAFLNGNNTATVTDLSILNYLPSWDQSLLTNLQEEIQQQKIYNTAKDAIREVETKFSNIQSRLNGFIEEKNAQKTLVIVGVLKKLEQEVNNISNIPDSLMSNRTSLLNKVVNLHRETLTNASELAIASEMSK